MGLPRSVCPTLGGAGTRRGPGSSVWAEERHFSPPFPLCCSRRVQEGEESGFAGARPRGGGQRQPRGSALAVLMWEGLGAARAAGWSPAPGWSGTAEDAAAPDSCAPGSRPGVEQSRQQQGCCQGLGRDQPHAPQAATRPRTAWMQQSHPTPGLQLTHCPLADTPTVPFQHPHAHP